VNNMIYMFRELTEITFLNYVMSWHQNQSMSVLFHTAFELEKVGIEIDENTIKYCAVSLQRQFKKLGVRLFQNPNADITKDNYILTEEAWDFIVANLHDTIYDENGEKEGEYFLHPNKLTGEMII
tara:strand:- start:952 stop:1326 length:375 start_codon:yes stop_codon:yes gene_type:complete